MHSTLWLAPAKDGPLDAVVEIPGSKSLTNRHLVLAALADAPTRVVGALRSRDTDLMVEALSALGVGFEWVDSSTLLVTPLGEEALQERSPVSIDCGLAGTVMRFVPYVAALLRRPVTFDGDAAARVRPMSAVIAGLRALGANVAGGEDGFLPFTVTGSDRVDGGEISLDASGSSQFVSGPLLVGARLPRGLVVRHAGGAVPSPQHVEMTVETLRAAGVDASVGADGVSWSVAAGSISPGDVVVEPDLSNAGPFLAAALVCGGRVAIPRWPASTTQIGAEWEMLLPRFGARVHREPDAFGTEQLVVTGGERISGVEADGLAELAPTAAALCALADGPSRLGDIAHLRGHETDRLAALATELSKVGSPTVETEDGLVISPTGELRPTVFGSYEDHRMATAGAIIGLAVDGLKVENIETTSKTMPDFPGMWSDMLSQKAKEFPGTEDTSAGQASVDAQGGGQ
ncbi:3-phosphoshikimate 1-carboxyvinyltransferase [Arthrobacter sp. HMSC06H05]|uniref:3-phosphoshikimate 1-carboxyvinyltransferase n=1 Tax=Arthrobacter sp. HMSC06H05 TaxID=1581128 RepID=UPI0008A59206|nr:3-phosphoshikimate 1-carboxyvinyltransferase [Arthrobacter sp. HMSC06H05]